MLKAKKIKKFGSLAIVLTVVAGLAVYTHIARSSALQNMSGYAWGGNWTDQNNNGIQDLNPNNVPYEPTGGLGWLSFNCTTGGNCGANDYGVNIDSNGNLVGWAWSSNYGWLKFGGLAGQQIGTNITSTDAKLVGNNIVGWARFCVAAADPNSCTGFVPNPSNGGWDGWLSLSGNGYGVQLNPVNGELSGYAWGGNDGGKNVVGWVNFNTDFSVVVYNPVTDPTVNLTVAHTSIPTGGHVELSWEGVNLIDSNNGCEATIGAPGDGWAGNRVSPEGDFTTSAINTNGTYTYSIRCLGENGSDWSPVSSVTVHVGVELDFYAEPSPVYSNNGYQTILHWGVSPVDGDLHNCQASSSTPGEDEWNGANIDDPDPTAEFGPVYVPADPTSFTIDCQNAINQHIVKTILVYRSDLPEAVDIWHTGPIVCQGQACTTTLSWAVVNAHSCVASSTPITPAWDGPIATPPYNNSQSGLPAPIASDLITYTLECISDSNPQGPHLIDSVDVNTESQLTQPPHFQEN